MWGILINVSSNIWAPFWLIELFEEVGWNTGCWRNFINLDELKLALNFHCFAVWPALWILKYCSLLSLFEPMVLLSDWWPMMTIHPIPSNPSHPTHPKIKSSTTPRKMQNDSNKDNLQWTKMNWDELKMKRNELKQKDSKTRLQKDNQNDSEGFLANWTERFKGTVVALCNAPLQSRGDQWPFQLLEYQKCKDWRRLS